jgi:hypothetical protein
MTDLHGLLDADDGRGEGEDRENHGYYRLGKAIESEKCKIGFRWRGLE